MHISLAEVMKFTDTRLGLWSSSFFKNKRERKELKEAKWGEDFYEVFLDGGARVGSLRKCCWDKECMAAFRTKD